MTKEKYEEILEELHWKSCLSYAGLNLLAYGNLFASINQGFNRFLLCPNCSKATNIDKIHDYEFSNKAVYTYTCPSCNYKGKHEISDKPSKDIEKVAITFWNPLEIITRFEDTTNESEYYWRIPELYKQKVMKKDNKFFSKKTPKLIYDAILKDRLVAFNPKNFLHVKFPAPSGMHTNGLGIPLCIYMFDDFFMLKVLQRYNEVICFEDIVPFRVIAMSGENNSQANPILHQNSAMWHGAIQKMIADHRKDPGSYHSFPFPFDYKQLGGEGKQLTPVDMMNQAIANILNALHIPQELYVMNMQINAIGPALRLFENSWSILVTAYNDILNHWADVIGKIKGLPQVKVGLTPVTLSDDMERKSIIGQLVSANAIARSELLNVYGFDYRDQLRKKKEEEEIAKELEKEVAEKEQLRQLAENGGEAGQPVTPSDVLENAQAISQELFPLDAASRREKLQKIKAQDKTLYSAVKQQLEELTQQARSQGVQQAQSGGQQ